MPVENLRGPLQYVPAKTAGRALRCMGNWQQVALPSSFRFEDFLCVSHRDGLNSSKTQLVVAFRGVTLVCTWKTVMVSFSFLHVRVVTLVTSQNCELSSDCNFPGGLKWTSCLSGSFFSPLYFVGVNRIQGTTTTVMCQSSVG